jgi:DNA-binding PadR family transcriptional regulator
MRRGCWDEPDYPVAAWGHRGPMFGMRRGDFRFLVLTALSEKPMHGYALIQELGRTYQRPVSAGLIYPTLQELEDRGYVRSEEKEGKKTYSVTEEGKKCLEENKETVERLKAGREYADRMGRFGFLKDLRDVQALVMMNDEYVDEKKMERIQEILGDAKKKVAAVVYE